jgi:hypothetical protein
MSRSSNFIDKSLADGTAALTPKLRILFVEERVHWASLPESQPLGIKLQRNVGVWFGQDHTGAGDNMGIATAVAWGLRQASEI